MPIPLDQDRPSRAKMIALLKSAAAERVAQSKILKPGDVVTVPVSNIPGVTLLADADGQLFDQGIVVGVFPEGRFATVLVFADTGFETTVNIPADLLAKG